MGWASEAPKDKRLWHWRTGGGGGREAEAPTDEASVPVDQTSDDDNDAFLYPAATIMPAIKKTTINQ